MLDLHAPSAASPALAPPDTVRHSPRPRGRKLRTAALCLCALAVAGVAFIAAADRWMLATTDALCYPELEAVPERPVAIVFGARVYPGGGLSPVLRHRVEAGVSLYQAGKVRKLLMTGDNGRSDYDEVTAMKRHAVSLGVPAEDVVRDYAGFRTYDSCYRAREIFAVDRAVLVTQAFHLPRAIYTARNLGIDAVGYSSRVGMAPDALRSTRIREALARAAAVIDVAFLRRQSKYLGPREPLFVNEMPTR